MNDETPPPIDDFYEALGRSIKVLRTDRGLERKDLADRAGISYSYLASIENGAKQPSSSVLVAIAEALGLRSHELLESVENRRDRTAAAAPSGDPWWLTADKPGRVAFRQMAPASAPILHEKPTRPQPSQDERGPDLATFIKEITDLAERLDPHQRETVLNVARKLQPGWGGPVR